MGVTIVHCFQAIYCLGQFCELFLLVHFEAKCFFNLTLKLTKSLLSEKQLISLIKATKFLSIFLELKDTIAPFLMRLLQAIYKRVSYWSRHLTGFCQVRYAHDHCILFYGNMGYQVSKGGLQFLIQFWPTSTFSKDIIVICHQTQQQVVKKSKNLSSKSLLYVENNI